MSTAPCSRTPAVILTSTAYHGTHYFTRTDSRAGTNRPPSEWIAMDVPAIIDERTFNAAQALLQSRQPRRTAPRLVNTPTLLAGIARCGYCGAALIQNTGKGGQYRYYACGSRLKKGATACRGQRMPMSKLDDIVIGEVTRRILHPDRLTVCWNATSRPPRSVTSAIAASCGICAMLMGMLRLVSRA